MGGRFVARPSITTERTEMPEMARFQNKKTGAVVSVSEAKADRFSPAEWDRHDGGPSSEPKVADLKVAELKAEIARRNDGRDEADMIADDGNKADLVAAIEADDE